MAVSTLSITEVATTAYTDQKPGTSGLRKKVPHFQQPNYVQNFVQATFDALRSPEAASFGGIPKVLVVGGDGRYFSPEVCQIIFAMAAANGVEHVIVGQHSLMSTPAVSVVIRTHPARPTGAFILTASHNPGGPKADFGLKYNCANGGPAPEKLTDLIYKQTLAITKYVTATNVPAVDLAVVAKHQIASNYTVEVIDSVVNYVDTLTSVFDMDALRRLVARPDFSLYFDGMHGVAGPYAKRVFVDVLGAPESSMHNCTPLPDFGEGHPDPNLTYAHDLVHALGLNSDGTVNASVTGAVPTFGAACDGDADRNMILGGRFFVTPSDSVAVLAANAEAIPYFARRGGLKSVARSMPTSAAVDRVAQAKGLSLFEVPTGWKFFGNLMDSKELFNGTEFTPLICGEESFGTGSDHVREKDGLWAVLAWLSVLAHANAATPVGSLITVQQIVEKHWATYGRNYYRRFDYEEVETAGANALMAHMRALDGATVDALPNGAKVSLRDDFEYRDPVDGSVSKQQGVRTVFSDGSRFVFRLSATGSSGATVRLYLEQYMPAADVAAALQSAAGLPDVAKVLEPLTNIALSASKLQGFINRDAPTVIT